MATGIAKVAQALQRSEAPRAFLWGSNGERLSPEEVASRRARAEGMRHPAGYTPNGWASLLGALAQEGVGKFKEDEANRAEKEGIAGVVDRFNAAKAAGTGYEDVLTDPWAAKAPGVSGVAAALMSRNFELEDRRASWARDDARTSVARAMAAAESAKPKWQTLESGGDTYRWDANDPDSKPMLFFDGPDAAPGAPEVEEAFDPATGRPIKQQWVDGGWQPLGGVAAPKDPLVTVNNGGETAYDKTLNENLAKSYLGTQDASTAALRTLTTLDAMTGAMEDPNFYSGFGAEPTLAVKQAIAGLGLDPSAASSMETFNALSKQSALDLMGGSLGTGFSNADRSFVVEQTANLGATKEGNKMLMDLQRKLAKRQVDVGKLANQYASEHGGRLDSGWGAYLANWVETNPVFDQKATGTAPGNGKTSGGLNWSIEP